MLFCVGPPAGLHDSAEDTGLLRVWEARTLRRSALLNFKLSCLKEKSAHVIAPVSSEQTSPLMEVRARGRTSRGGAWPTPNSIYFWFLIAYLSLSLSLRYGLGAVDWFLLYSTWGILSLSCFFLRNTQWPFLFGCPDFMPEHRVRFISSKGPIVLHSEGNWWASQAGMRGG